MAGAEPAGGQGDVCEQAPAPESSAAGALRGPPASHHQAEGARESWGMPRAEPLRVSASCLSDCRRPRGSTQPADCQLCGQRPPTSWNAQPRLLPAPGIPGMRVQTRARAYLCALGEGPRPASFPGSLLPKLKVCSSHREGSDHRELRTASTLAEAPCCMAAPPQKKSLGPLLRASAPAARTCRAELQRGLCGRLPDLRDSRLCSGSHLSAAGPRQKGREQRLTAQDGGSRLWLLGGLWPCAHYRGLEVRFCSP